jgi:hypothetical protein
MVLAMKFHFERVKMANDTHTVSILNKGSIPNIHMKMCQKRKPW